MNSARKGSVSWEITRHAFSTKCYFKASLRFVIAQWPLITVVGSDGTSAIGPLSVLLQRHVVTGCLTDGFGPAIVTRIVSPISLRTWANSLLIFVLSLSAGLSRPVPADCNTISNAGGPDLNKHEPCIRVLAVADGST